MKEDAQGYGGGFLLLWWPFYFVAEWMPIISEEMFLF